MDITEAFRSEDISKTDFFDFVVGQDVVGDSQQLNRTLKSMGIYIEPPTTNSTSVYVQDVKETNNNHLMMNTVSDHHHQHQHNHIPSTYEQTPTPFWSTAATTTSSSNTCDKEAVRIESAILEDLSKLWNESPSGEAGGIKGSGNGNNTDGAIYTLTVLNGGHSPGSWYRTPENPAAIKQEEENHGSPHDHQHKQQMSPHGQVPSSSASSALDLDSILSIIPTQQPPPSSPSTNHHYHHNGFSASSNAMSPHQDKSEQYTAVFEDSNYNNKDCISNGISHSPNNGTESPIGSGFNNNDWKMANNNSSNNTTGNTAAAAAADSLLRNALQGKSCFLGRYNGNVAGGQQKMNCSKDNATRTLSSSPPKTGDAYITGDMVVATDEHRSSPLMAESVVMFDGGGSTTGSSHTMDDILLYQGEDLEQQINIIANDVLESASRRQQQSYCSLDQNSNSSPTSSMYIPSPMLATDTLVHHHSPIMSSPSPHLHHHHHHHHHLSPILQQPPQPPPPQSSISTTSRPAKKYSKKPTGGVKSHMQGSQHQGSNGNGVRKERSLHYCNICNKGFKDKYSVNVHIRTHTGEKPFACTVCGKSFRQKAHLAKHYQTHITQKNNSGQTGNASGYKNSKGRFNGAKAPTS